MDRYAMIDQVVGHLKDNLLTLDTLGLMAASACVCSALHHIEFARNMSLGNEEMGVDFSEQDEIITQILG